MAALRTWLHRPSLWISAILVAHLALAVGWGVSMPLFEEFDEASHVLYVRYLQVYHALPVQNHNSEGPRAHHPPAFYVIGALLTAWVPVNGSVDAIHLDPNPNFRITGGDTESDNKSRYIHYTPDERFPYAGIDLETHLLRLLSAALSTAAVWLTYRTARALRPGDAPFALLAASLVAFNPDVIALGGTVYNDTAALFGGSLILYTVTRSGIQGFTPWRWFWVSAALGLGLLFKLNVLALGVPVGLLWLWETGRELWRRRSAALRPLALNALAIGGPFAVLTGWWFVRNLRLYGDLTANKAIIALWGSPQPQDTSVWRQTLSLLDNPIGRFGTGQWTSFPDWAYIGARILIIAGAAGAVFAAVKYFRARHATRAETAQWSVSERGVSRSGVSQKDATHVPTDTLLQAETGHTGETPHRGVSTALKAAEADPVARLWVFHLAAVFVLAASVVYYAVTVVGWTATRFMYPAFTSIVLIMAAGLLAWAGPRWRGWLALAVGLASVALAAYGLFGLAIPIYGPPRAPRAAELARMMPLDAQIGGVARLLGYQLDTSHLSSNGVLDVTVYWDPLTRTATPYSVFVHLFEPGVGSLAQRDTYPGGGNWATTVWDPNRPFVETFHLHVPPQALPVTDGQILIGLYDRNTMARLPVAGRDAVPNQGWIAFGSLNLQP